MKNKTYPKYRFVVFGLLLLALLAQPFNNFGLSTLAVPIKATMSLSNTQFGLLSTLVAFCMGVFSFGGGAILANIGIKKCYAIALGIMALGGISLGFAAMLASYPLMLICRFITGIGFGMMYPVKTAVVMKWFPQKERLLMNALTLSVTYAGFFFLFKWILGIYAGLGENIGLTLIIIGCIALFACIMWVIFYKENHPDLPDYIENPPQKEKVKFTFAPVKELWDNKYIRLMAIGTLGHYIAWASINTFFPLFFNEKFASIISDKAELAQFSNGIASYMPLAGLVAIIAAVFIATPLKNRKLFIWPLQLLFLFGCLGSIFSVNPEFVKICQIIIGASSAAWYPAFTTLPMELPDFSPAKIGIAMGIIFGFGNFTQFLMGLIGGSLADIIGMQTMLFIVCTVGLVIATVCFMFLPETRGRKVNSYDEFKGTGINVSVEKI